MQLLIEAIRGDNMLNPMDMTNRTVLVTGASSGIGRETSVLLSQLGARVVLVARNVDRLQETAARLEGTGHCIESVDLTQQVDDIPAWLKRLAADVGPLHGLVHSAGTQITRPVRFQTNADVDSLMRINLNAVFGLAKGFRQKGVCTADGRLVLLSSVMGLVGQATVTAYAASKGALIALTKSLAMEFARDGLRVNCVAPAHVKTEMAETLQDALTDEQFEAIKAMHPLGIGTPLDVAYAIAFLLADTGRWITGTTLVVDGGYTAH
jgi:NAD(P)-dependent dehydrogenase (short-subunit alcohol dehydrogenase family)